MATLYGAQGSTMSASDLYVIDPLSPGSPTAVGPTGFGLTGLAWDAVTQTLYGATNTNSLANPKSLVTIDTSTGAGSLVGAFGGTARISDLTCDAAGNLFGVDAFGGGFGSIDKTTGAYTHIGGTVVGGGVSADSGDVFYSGVQDDSAHSLETIDPATGVYTLVASFSGSPNSPNGILAALAFDDSDALWGIESQNTAGSWRLIVIDATTAAITNQGSLPDRFDALEWAGATVHKIVFRTIHWVD